MIPIPWWVLAAVAAVLLVPWLVIIDGFYRGHRRTRPRKLAAIVLGVLGLLAALGAYVSFIRIRF